MQTLILDTVTLRHFVILGRVQQLRSWVGSELLIPQRVHLELLTGVEKHRPETLSRDPEVAQERSARFRAYPDQHAAWGIQVLPSPDVAELHEDTRKLFLALETQVHPAIHAGEKEVILLAYERGYRICTDDRGAYRTIMHLASGAVPGVATRPLMVVGTLGLLRQQIEQDQLTEDMAQALWSEVQEVWQRAPKGTLQDILSKEYW